MPFSTYSSDALMDHIRPGGATYTQPSALYAALNTADPTAAALDTEISGGLYDRQLVTFGAPSGGYIANTNELVFTSLPTLSPGVTYVSIWDEETGGNMIHYDDIPTEIIDAGDNIRVLTGVLRLAYVTSL